LMTFIHEENGYTFSHGPSSIILFF